MTVQPKYHCRLAQTKEDTEKAQRLRARAFGLAQERDQDPFDAHANHMLVERQDGRLVATFRFLTLDQGADISRSYTAQFYDLSKLARYKGKMVEMGRFCIDPQINDPVILRVAWAAFTSYVTTHHVGFLFGCASFQGTDQAQYEDAFLLLKSKHLAPKRWLPQIKAPRVFRYAQLLKRPLNRVKAMGRMPPLLKTYLMMGGWVSDHAVIDDEMNTLHVFTGVEVAAIPDARRRALLNAMQAMA